MSSKSSPPDHGEAMLAPQTSGRRARCDDWPSAITELEPSIFRRFLRSRGWQESESVRGRSFLYGKQLAEGWVEVEIPTSLQLSDYARRIIEAAELLCLAEQFGPGELLRSLLHPAADLLRFRFTGEELEDGTLSLDDSLRLRSARRQMLLAVAHSVVEPLPHFSRLSRSEPLEFLRRCREAPARAGSFVSEVIVPVPAPCGEPDSEPPFARRTTELLARALHRTAAALERGEEQALLQAAGEGVSSNFLTALAELAPPGGRGAFELEFGWAQVRPIPATVPGHRQRIGGRLFEPLGEAARVLRETTELPGCDLEGFVVRLQRSAEDVTGPGEIVLVSVVEGRPGTSKVHVTLGPGPYRLAVDAHARAAKVRVTGTLRKEGRRLILEDPGGFMLIGAGEE